MGCIYCLYSTENGCPRYVGKASDKVSYRYHKHITATLEKTEGDLYEWIRDAWRRGFDVEYFILQERVIPKDIDMFEQYWISQFTNLFNKRTSVRAKKESETAMQIKKAIQKRLAIARTSPVK